MGHGFNDGNSKTLMIAKGAKNGSLPVLALELIVVDPAGKCHVLVKTESFD